MRQLIAGYSRFRKEILPRRRPLFQQLAHGQKPCALLITCSDSRVVPDLITQSDPGDLFICRNAGNIVPPYGEMHGGVSATIEYAVLALGVENIIVCGHSDCGAMKGVMHPDKLRDMPTVQTWLRHADAARRVVEESYPPMDEATRLRALTEENVVSQLDHLRTHPSVAARLARGRLNLYGWVFDIYQAELRTFDAQQGCFVPLDGNATPSTLSRPRLQLVNS